MKLPVIGIIYVIDTEEGLSQKKTGKVKGLFPVPVTPSGTMDSLISGNYAVDGYQVRIYLYDTCCTKKTKKFAEHYVDAKEKTAEVLYLERKGQSRYVCYNEALEQHKDLKWIHFTRSSTYYSAEALINTVKNTLKYSSAVMAMIPYQYTAETEKEQLYFKRRNCVLDLNRDPFYLNYCLSSLFMEREAVENLRFDETIPYDIDEFFLIQLYEKTGRYAVTAAECVCYIEEFLPTDPYNYEPEYDKDWYTRSVRETYTDFLLKNPSSRIRQSGLFYQIELKFFANGNDRNKTIFTKAEQMEFYDAVKKFLHLIDDDLISQFKWTHRRVLQRHMGMNFLRLKYDDYNMLGHVKKINGDPVIVTDKYGIQVDALETITFNIMAINYEDGCLKFDGELGNVYYADFNKLSMWAEVGDKRVDAVQNQIYSYEKYFGESVKKGYMVQIAVPKELLKSGIKIRFKAKYDGSTTLCRGAFKKLQSHFDQAFGGYWRFSKYILKPGEGREENFYFTLEKDNLKNRVKSEIAFHRVMKSKHALLYRTLYFMTKPLFAGRKVWITFDQLFKGGDNGEYFFRYVNEHHRHAVKMYYVVNESAKEYKELKKKYGRVLKFNSLWLRLVSLHADMIFATRVDVRLYCGLDLDYEYFIRDLFNAEVVCLQHGLTIQKIAQYQNRLFDNLKYYYCVSPYEVENIMNPLYGYTEDMISLTGAPRYDGLVGEPKKQILIAPTWRRNVTAGTNKKGSNHEYSVNFKNTTYFNVYNTLINDKRLIECARKTGYKLIYLIHPILSPQVNDFDQNEFVEIRPGVNVNYETILKESSLMVSDYSGIQFDFAYMRRPLVYYHPDALPPQYDEGNLKYDTMGFGPVCKNNEEIVDALCHFMEQDCRLDEEYRQRIEKFFPYNDQNNCQRIYDATLEWEKKRKKNNK